MSFGRTSTALGTFYRRLAARIGKAKAITATARKLAVLVYRLLSGDLRYQAPSATAYHQLNHAREPKSLRKRARLLGFDLLDHSTGEVLPKPNPVSQEERHPGDFELRDVVAIYLVERRIAHPARIVAAVGPFSYGAAFQPGRRPTGTSAT